MDKIIIIIICALLIGCSDGKNNDMSSANEIQGVVETLDGRELIISGSGVLEGKCLYKDIEELVICDGICEIGKGYFKNLDSLKKVTISGTVKKIGANSFLGCNSLQDLKICEGVKIIDDASFKECSNLRQIEIPSSVEQFSYTSIKECRGLTKIINKSNISIDLPVDLLITLPHGKWICNGEESHRVKADSELELVGEKYKISYSLNGGESKTPMPLNYIYGSWVTLPSNIYRDGYAFVGWMWDGDENSGINPKIIWEIGPWIQKDFKLCACWIDITISSSKKNVYNFCCKYDTGGRWERFACVIRLRPLYDNDKIKTEYLIFDKGKWTNKKENTKEKREIECFANNNIAVEYSFISYIDYEMYVDKIDRNDDGDEDVIEPWMEGERVWKTIDIL
ncbi:MAG: leucine-rich repeat protein [Eubacterium sp.]|nr:leucine-rich repeat protein [Eubacterium sp.]